MTLIPREPDYVCTLCITVGHIVINVSCHPGKRPGSLQRVTGKSSRQRENKIGELQRGSALSSVSVDEADLQYNANFLKVVCLKLLSL